MTQYYLVFAQYSHGLGTLGAHVVVQSATFPARNLVTSAVMAYLIVAHRTAILEHAIVITSILPMASLADCAAWFTPGSGKTCLQYKQVETDATGVPVVTLLPPLADDKKRKSTTEPDDARPPKKRKP